MTATVLMESMDPAERAGFLFSFLLFLVGGILLLVFGIRRLGKRSRMLRERNAAQYGYPPPQPGYDPNAGYPPPPSAPYGPPAPPVPPGNSVQSAAKPPNQGISIAMIVLGALLLLGVLGNLANAASSVS